MSHPKKILVDNLLVLLALRGSTVGGSSILKTHTHIFNLGKKMTLADFSIRLFNCRNCYLFVFLLLNQVTSFAQETSLADLRKQWAEMEIKFAEKQTAIELSQGDNSALSGEYRNLVDQANALVEQIKTKSLNVLQENPTDAEALRAIMGVLLNAAQNGRDKEVLSIGDVLIAKSIDPRYFEIAANADRLSIEAREIFEELLIRQRETTANDLPQVKLKTSKGDITLELFENQAPNTVKNFISLVEAGHYSDLLFHRVVEGFMAQAGEKKSDGQEAPNLNYTIACECYSPETRPHFSDCISMAHSGKDTGAGQFFLTFTRTSMLDGRHTCFGRIIAGNEVLDKIERTHMQINNDEQPIPNAEKDKIISAEIIRKRDHEYRPTKLGEPDPAAQPLQEKPPADPNLTPAADPAPEMKLEPATSSSEEPKSPNENSTTPPTKPDGVEKTDDAKKPDANTAPEENKTPGDGD